jgi:hypothetical protein
MRAAAGASRDQRAYTGLVFVFVMAGLTVAGVMFLPTLTSKIIQRNNTAEEVMLATLEEGFRDYVRIHQIIPGTSTWATAMASVGGLNVTQANCVLPDFASDTTIQRVFVVDDFLGGASPLLPYTQSTNGLSGTQTNLLNARARAMIVSSTKRGLALPVSTGFLSQTNFDAIWNWTYNPATEAPPSGWSSAWTGNGEFLHVKPLPLPNLFSKITLQNVKYGIGSSNHTTTIVSSQTDYYFLNGTRMALATTGGTLKQTYVVTRDNSFSFPTSSGGNHYYLTGNGIPTDTDGIPCAQLTNVAPTATSLPNYDPGRDAFAGLLVQKGGSGATESDATKIQKWITSAGSITINGTVSFTLFTAMKEFQAGKGGKMVAYLVECNSSGGSPTTLASATLTRNPWDVSGTGTWIQDTISFGFVSRTIGSTLRLGVFIIVHSDSEDDMWFAYGTTTYNSRLTLP